MKPRDQVREIYKLGIQEGLCAYAHWKDGRQYVGTSGKTLLEAIKDLDSDKYPEISEELINVATRQLRREIENAPDV